MITQQDIDDFTADVPASVQRAKRDTKDPCVKCGWSRYLGIHQPRYSFGGHHKMLPICEYESGGAVLQVEKA